MIWPRLDCLLRGVHKDSVSWFIKGTQEAFLLVIRMHKILMINRRKAVIMREKVKEVCYCYKLCQPLTDSGEALSCKSYVSVFLGCLSSLYQHLLKPHINCVAGLFFYFKGSEHLLLNSKQHTSQLSSPK